MDEERIISIEKSINNLHERVVKLELWVESNGFIQKRRTEPKSGQQKDADLPIGDVRLSNNYLDRTHLEREEG